MRETPQPLQVRPIGAPLAVAEHDGAVGKRVAGSDGAEWGDLAVLREREQWDQLTDLEQVAEGEAIAINCKEQKINVEHGEVNGL